MATPPFLPDETKPGASDLISLYPSVEQTFRDVLEDWILWEHNTGGTHKRVTLDDISEPTIAAAKVGLWHESGVLKTRFAGATAYDILTANTGLKLIGGTLTGDLVLAGAPGADLCAATKLYVDTADALKADLASPALTGTPTSPTASAGDNDTSIATTAFVTAAVAASGITRRTALTTTSGTAHGFTAIPAGTNRITFMLSVVSLSGTDELLIQIGDSGGYETSVYSSAVGKGTNSQPSTAGFIIAQNAAAVDTWSGQVLLSRLDANTWVSSGWLRKSTGDIIHTSAGIKTLSAELDRIQIVATGDDTFDAGSVNITTEV